MQKEFDAASREIVTTVKFGGHNFKKQLELTDFGLMKDIISQKDVYILHKYSNILRHCEITVNIFCLSRVRRFFRLKHKVSILTMYIQIF